MAIREVFNSLTFGGVNSLEYGVYVSGPGVFDAPTRDVELVSVPGRNGAIEIDRGHWNNIEIRYTAGVFGENQSEFSHKMKAFRNAIVSQVGYQRLSDTYNSNEFRLGVYVSGVEVSPINMNEAGEFELVFNCKPQRFLMTGETFFTTTDGENFQNPTLYNSSPLLLIEGCGAVGFNGYSIEIEDITYGDINISNATSGAEVNVQYDPKMFKNTDLIEIASAEYMFRFSPLNGKHFASTPSSVTIITNSLNATYRIIEVPSDIGEGFFLYVDAHSFDTIEAGPSGMAETKEFVGTFVIEFTDETSEPVGINASLRRLNGTLSFRQNVELVDVNVFSGRPYIEVGNIVGHSTKNILGDSNEIFVDTEIGEVYTFEDGDYIDLNKYVALGSDLPVFVPGDNVVSVDSTITTLKIAPRWWEL